MILFSLFDFMQYFFFLSVEFLDTLFKLFLQITTLSLSPEIMNPVTIAVPKKVVTEYPLEEKNTQSTSNIQSMYESNANVWLMNESLLICKC